MARQHSLQEFQQDLVRRISEAAGDAAPTARLGVQAGDSFWLVRLDEAGEIFPVPRVTTVPLTQQWFRGLANVRGNLYSVIDFSLFCGGEPTRESADGRLMLVAEHFHVSTALLVSKMLGLRNVQQLRAEQSPAGHPWASTQYIDADGRIWRELNIRDLVGRAEFLDAGV